MATTTWKQLLELRRVETHKTSYDMADVVTDTEVEEILVKARQFEQLVETWITDNHPHWGTGGQPK